MDRYQLQKMVRLCTCKNLLGLQRGFVRMYLPRTLDKIYPLLKSAADSTLAPSGNVFTCDQKSALSISTPGMCLFEAAYVPIS